MARVRHAQDDWRPYHLTTRTIDQGMYLADSADKQAVLDALAFYRARGLFRLYGFVIMDNHIHVVIHPGEGVPYADVMDGFKTWTSRHNSAKPRAQLWERRYDDNAILSHHELRQVLRYVHDNPVRAGIVTSAEGYPWSSVHNYLGNGKGLIQVDTDWWQTW